MEEEIHNWIKDLSLRNLSPSIQQVMAKAGELYRSIVGNSNGRKAIFTYQWYEGYKARWDCKDVTAQVIFNTICIMYVTKIEDLNQIMAQLKCRNIIMFGMIN